MQRQQSLSQLTGGIPRVADLSSDEFLEHFYAPSRPCVIEGALAGWPALERWTPAYLKARVGSPLVEFQGARNGDPRFELLKDKHKMRAPFDAFIDAIAEARSNDAYLTAYNSASNAAALAPLYEDLGDIPNVLTPGGGMLWIGPEGTFTPLHFDLTNNLLAQITGRKRLVLVPPSESSKMAHHRHVFSEVHDLEDPACLARHPQAANVRHFTVEIGPGDLLYIPVGWWHQVRSLSFSTMLTYTNFLWPNDVFGTYPEG
ncbi:MAG: cupin-like domain-containing protein [Alphaproteobacteria bacterium]|nr:cupin-like domain-containing protein [Alphaproteobacteria bacterium]